MIRKWATRSLRVKLVLMALSTTLIALVAASCAMVAYDLRTFQRSWVDDLVTQAEILAAAGAPALAFDDPKAAQEYLRLLRIRPQIVVGVVYTSKGTRFAAYARQGIAKPKFPDAPGALGSRIENGRLVVAHPVMEAGERIGTVYLEADYPLVERLKNYVLILALVMFGSLLIAAFVVNRLQAGVTGPILAVTEAANDVIQHRNFSHRAPKSSSDEIGVLVDAFNSMLGEIEQRTVALEASNASLGQEMAVRVHAENALRDADRRKDEFLATLAHELRNPLAPIASSIELLGLKSDDPAAVLRTREVMARQVKQMVRLVDDLLDVSRITTGKLMIQKNRIELQTVVTSALETVSGLIQARGHTLEVELPPTPLSMCGDAARLAQVLSNLLNNAAKYTRPGGRIRLSVTAGNADVVISVVDNGIGLSAAMLPRVFELFVQADNSLERVQTGLGVGLALARQIVELHGGTIEAQSSGTNTGSTFIVRLPLVAQSFQLDDFRQGQSSVSRPYRILLVDDNVDFALSMGDLLTTLGHTVQIAHDGVNGLAAAALFKPEFIFLDIGMPKMNGYDLARNLRARLDSQQSVLVAITGWGQEGDRQRTRAAGFDHHLVKPVDMEQIQTILAAGNIHSQSPDATPQ